MNVFLATSTVCSNKDIAKITKHLKTSHQVYHYSHKINEVNDEHDFNSVLKEIQCCDVFIGEMSGSSQTLGFQLAFALQASKPSLYLYSKPLKKEHPRGMIGHIPTRGLKFKQYDSENIHLVLDKFIKFAESQMATTRTSFMSTKEIDSYVNRESARLSISKGEVIRRALHNESRVR